MKIKTFIIGLLIVIIPLITFRILTELKYRNVSILADYNDIVDNFYVYNTDIDFQKYLKRLYSLGLTSIFIFNHTVDNFLAEYNEAMLLKGFYAQNYFPNYYFNKSDIYLFIPESIIYRIKKFPKFKRKFKIKDYTVLEFNSIYRDIKNMYMDYNPYYYEKIKQSKIKFIKVKKITFTKEIDNFIIKRRGIYYIGYPDNKDKHIARIHYFLKEYNKKNLIKHFVNENFRAVMERKVRVILLKKIYPVDKSKFIPFEKMLEKLTPKLKKYKFGIAPIDRVIKNVKPNLLFYFTKYAIVLLLTSFLILNYKQNNIVILSIFSVLIISLYFKIFYIVVLLVGLYFINDVVLKYKSENKLNYITYIYLIGYIFLLGLTVSSVLWNFLEINKMIGIKLIFTLPFLLLIFQYFLYNNSDINATVKIKHLLLITIFGIIGIIVLLRSGNFYIHPSNFEIKIREWLEKVFIIRPRFKEFLIGYPSLALLFIFYKKSNFISDNFIIFYILGLIGISTTLNSFLHIHTDIIITLMRSIIGIIIGTFIGIVTGFFISYIEKNWQKIGFGGIK